MKKGPFISLVLFMFLALFFLGMGNVAAFDLITAKEAYDMVNNGQATLIDVRTLEEYVFVGSPALEPGGDPIAYLIPWEHLEGVDEYGQNEYSINPDFDALIDQTFGDDKNQALIIICRSGNRSSHAAKLIEENGYSNVYEVDNKLSEMTSFPGGRGGFQGSSYNSSYNGYRGYPHRLPNEHGFSNIKVETVTNNIDSEDDSVSWMDSDLPITQNVDPDKIPKIKREVLTNKASQSKSVTSWLTSPLLNYQGFSNSMIQPYYSLSLYQSPISITGSMFPYGLQYGLQSSSFQPYNWYQSNQPFYSYSNMLNGFQLSPNQSSSQSSCQKEKTGST